MFIIIIVIMQLDPVLPAYMSNDRLLPAGMTVFSNQSPIQRIAVANQLNHWRSLEHKQMSLYLEGTAAEKYKDKIYDLSEVSTRSYFVKAYFDVDTEFTLAAAV